MEKPVELEISPVRNVVVGGTGYTQRKMVMEEIEMKLTTELSIDE